MKSDLLATHRWKEGTLKEGTLEVVSSIHALSSWHQGSQTNSPLKCRFQNRLPRNPSLWSVRGIPSFLCGRNQSPEELFPANCALIESITQLRNPDKGFCCPSVQSKKSLTSKSRGESPKSSLKRTDGPIICPHSLYLLQTPLAYVAGPPIFVADQD